MKKTRSVSLKRGTNEETKINEINEDNTNNIQQIDKQRFMKSLSTWRKPLKEIYPETDDVVIDKIISEIRFRKPRNAFTLFMMKEMKNIDKNIEISERNNIVAKKWEQLSRSKKAEYEQLSKQEREKYKQDLLFIRQFLFMGEDGEVRKSETDFDLFVMEKRINIYNSNENEPKNFKERCREEYKHLTKSEKKKYKEMAYKKLKWVLDAKKLKKINPSILFLQEKIDQAKKEKKDLPNIIELQKEWKELSKVQKKKYERLYEDILSERELLTNVFEITHFYRRRKPCGAFRMYIYDLIKQNKGKVNNITINEAEKMWNDLDMDLKEEYEKKAARLVLAKKYKEMVENKKIVRRERRFFKRHTIYTAFWELYRERFKKKKRTNEEIKILYENSSSFMKTQAKGLLEKKLKDQEEALKLYHQRIYDYPKRPPSIIQLYYKKHLDEIKEKVDAILKQKESEGMDLKTKYKIRLKNTNEITKDMFIKCDKDEIKELEEERKKYFNDFKAKMKEFKEFGYFSKSNINEEAYEKELKKRKQRLDKKRKRMELREKREKERNQKRKLKNNSNNKMDIDEDNTNKTYYNKSTINPFLPILKEIKELSQENNEEHSDDKKEQNINEENTIVNDKDNNNKNKIKKTKKEKTKSKSKNKANKKSKSKSKDTSKNKENKNKVKKSKSKSRTKSKNKFNIKIKSKTYQEDEEDNTVNNISIVNPFIAQPKTQDNRRVDNTKRISQINVDTDIDMDN